MSGILHGVLGSAGFQYVPVTISSNTNNYNIATAVASALGYTPTAPINAVVTVGSGIIVGQTTTVSGSGNGRYQAKDSVAAMRTGTLPTGSTLTLINNGYIIGCGGQGGAYSTPNSSARGTQWAGGDALYVEYPLTIYNNYVIGGGGGGGPGGDGSGPASVGGGGGAGYYGGVGGYGYGVAAAYGNDGFIGVGSISGTTLTITSVITGSIWGSRNQQLSGAGVTAGSLVTGIISGSGGVGTYSVNTSQTVSSTLMFVGGSSNDDVLGYCQSGGALGNPGYYTGGYNSTGIGGAAGAYVVANGNSVTWAANGYRFGVAV